MCSIVTKQTGFDYSARIKPSLVLEKNKDTYSFIQNKDFCGNNINFDTDFYIPIEVAKQYPKITLDTPSILVSISGKIGNVGFYNHKEVAFIGGAVGICKLLNEEDGAFSVYELESDYGQKYFQSLIKASSHANITVEDIRNIQLVLPKSDIEKKKIQNLFENIDNLITLHQQKNMKGKNIMKNLLRKSELFYEYYEKWISVYKVGAIRDVTMKKYKLTLNWLKKLVPTLEMKDLTRITYQQLLNDYAECHEKQSTMDFHHQLKGAILDAVDEGIIIRDPTRKAIIKGKIPKEKKIKYLNQFELQKLIADLDLGTKINYDWLILLIAKTGMRFSEALAITPKDFDFPHQMLTINKTWDYKGNGGFLPTKNTSSNRKVQLDWQTAIQFSELIKELDEDEPIFFTEKIYNSTINDILERHCKNVSVPIISIHGLRHTHASILLFAGVSIASVAHRLGHSSMTTTQKTYLHIIQELENTDIDLIMRSLTALNR